MRRITHPPRRAFVMLSAVVLITIVASLAAAWTGAVLRHRGLTRLAAQHVQAEWLAESALRRGLARLKSEPDFEGEAWTLTPNELQQGYGAAVETRLEERADEGRRLIAVVHIPNDSDPRVTHTASLRLPNANAGDTP